ncbi:Sialin like protein [Argiope bruennichi]|uniref:Sialin like protein n=1 Tax=Argiope bruennichi TaxID=94029 RepID=A0A8T0F779_ARGBR|nr:Sialin like protein [Argiope bruennichi]
MQVLDVTVPEKAQRCYIPKRFIVAFLGFFGLVNVYALRANLSVAMVAMVNNTEGNTKVFNSSRDECPDIMGSSNDSIMDQSNSLGEKYNWDAKTQGMIMSSFFYAYFITVLTGGYFAKRFGAKLMFGSGIGVTSILTLLTPVAVRWGIIPFIIVRALEGVGEGLTYPAINTMVSQWAPKLERSRISSAVFSGTSIGTVSGLLTGLPNILEALGGMMSSYVADKLISSKTLSVTTVRKIFQSIAMVGSGICVLAITVSGCQASVIIILYSLLLYVNGFKCSGYNVTHVDMYPPLAGVLYGLTNSISSLTGIIVPNMTGAFTVTGNTRSNWNKVFYVTAGVYFISAILYDIFASAELQPWGSEKKEKKQSNTSETKS